MAAISPSDVWAAGEVGDPNTPYYQIVEHWDGRQWHFVSGAPNPFDSSIPITSMTAGSASDVWAVGSQFVEHWNGHDWRRVPLSRDSGVAGVVSIGPGRAMAAGGKFIDELNATGCPAP